MNNEIFYEIYNTILYGSYCEKNIMYKNMSIDEAINEATIYCNEIKQDVFLQQTSLGTFYLKVPQMEKVVNIIEELNFNIKYGMKTKSICYHFKYNVQKGENKSTRKRLQSFYKQVEETKVEETKVEETKVEETKVEETKVEETKVEYNKVYLKYGVEMMPFFSLKKTESIENDLDVFQKTFHRYSIIDKISGDKIHNLTEEELKSINYKKNKKELIKTSTHIGSKKQEIM
jgi:hypothetical protein